MAETLGKKLWNAVEADQGHSFVSDDMCFWPDDRVISFCLTNLAATRRVVRAFERISRGYQLTPPADHTEEERRG